jgi:hypothetical protein
MYEAIIEFWEWWKTASFKDSFIMFTAVCIVPLIATRIYWFLSDYITYWFRKQ